ncbi:SPOSA6832_02557, partial [Sporobolomyces salmonicolor]
MSFVGADLEKDAQKYGLAPENPIFAGVDGMQEGTVQRSFTGCRKLKARHLQHPSAYHHGLKKLIISLLRLHLPYRSFTAIGTGLFVGAGSALATGGTAGLFLGYTIMATIVYSMMVALGEMTTMFPVFVDPALGFALGWNYWYSWAITIPTEITAAALVLDYWKGGQNVNVAVWITVFFVVITSFNFMGVQAFGEAEFWFSLIKIITLLGLMILSIIITSGGVPNSDPSYYPIGFRFWHETPFKQMNGIPGSLGRFLSFWTVFLQASFSFLGTEIVALTAGEAENPRRNVPKAIRRVFWRIVFFYVIGVLCMSLIVSPNDPGLINNSGAAASPWVIGIEKAGIKVLPSIINAVILVAAFSAGNSDLYAASRTLYGLACDGQAPAIFSRCLRNGLPIYALIATASIGLLAYMNVSTGSTRAFNDLVALSSITGLINWAVICFTFLRFYYGAKAQGLDRNDFPYKAPLQPYASYFGFIMLCIIIFFNSITIPVFFILWIGYKLWYKTQFVRKQAMDFDTGRRELDAMEEEQQAMRKEPQGWAGKLWDWMM